MTPKEKAIELFDKFNDEIPSNDSANVDEFMQRDVIASKNCALIAVDEIISICPYQTYKETLCPYDGAELSTYYWEEVKQEIEKS